MKGKIHVIKIYGFFALVTPMFEPTLKTRRKDKLKEIKGVLEKLYSEKKKAFIMIMAQASVI